MRRRHSRLSSRRRQERARRVRRRLAVLAAVLLLASLAMSQGLRDAIARAMESGKQAAQAFASTQAEEATLMLPRREVYALQLGVYDNGESAQTEMQRLIGEGLPCIIWQREQMRVVCSAAFSREALSEASAQGREVCVITDEMPEVRLRLSAAQGETEKVMALLQLPDALLLRLLGEETALEDILAQADEEAQSALGDHPENLLYTQLAQSLINWCALIRQTQALTDEAAARNYAGVTMCTLCMQLRQELSALPTAEAA